MIPLIEPIRWMAIGAALASEKFSLRLSKEVGSNAFDGPSRDAYGYIEQIAAGLPLAEAELCKIVGLQKINGDKTSDLMLRALAKEAEAAWMIRRTPYDQRQMLELSTRVSHDAALLASWAKRIRQ